MLKLFEMRYLVTTAIPYINSDPHIGFLWELLLADFFARYQRNLGFDVRFITGTDENAIKVQRAAEEAGISTIEFVNKRAATYQKLINDFDISINKFIRTSSWEHKNFVQKFWLSVVEDIYFGEYSGLYCFRCEDFYEETELENGVCPVHHKPVEIYKEKNYFFRLTKYLPRVQKLLEKNIIKILPTEKKKEILTILKSGKIKDISISRSKQRTKGWGIEVPGDNSQVIYVWFDALLNYLTGSEDIWQNKDLEIIHIFGKEITKFHLIYWPAMLLAGDYKMFNRAVIHGHILNRGEKMSKSLGNVIAPSDLLNKYDPDVIRYYFLRHSQIKEDWSFSWENLEQIYEGELKKEIGNLISRINGIFKNKNFSQKVKISVESSLKSAIYNFQFLKISEIIIKKAKSLNSFIDKNRLWEKEDKKNYQLLISKFGELISLLDAVMPQTTLTIRNFFLENGTFISPKIQITPLFK